MTPVERFVVAKVEIRTDEAPSDAGHKLPRQRRLCPMFKWKSGQSSIFKYKG